MPFISKGMLYPKKSAKINKISSNYVYYFLIIAIIKTYLPAGRTALHPKVHLYIYALANSIAIWG